MGLLRTTVQAPFVADDTGFGNGRLLWELHAGVTVGAADAVRLYPGSGLQQPFRVRANIGTVAAGPIATFVRKEVVQFGGGDTAATKYPIVGGFQYRNFGILFDRNGQPVGGGSAGPSILVSDAGGGSTPLILRGTRAGVQANISIYGAIEVTYQTSYRIYYYTPQIEILTGIGGVIGSRITKGFLAAFENGNVAVFELPLSTFPDTDDKEVYRIVSNAVVNEDGAFEEPEGWTGQPGSPTHDDGTPDPGKANITHERVHEAGYVTPQGSFFTRRYNVRTENPFRGSYSYKPTFKMVVATVGQNGITGDDLSSSTVQTAITSAEARFGIE